MFIYDFIFSSISFYGYGYLFSTHDTSQLPGVDVRRTVVNSTATAVSWHEIHLRPTCDISSACKIWKKDEQGDKKKLLDFGSLNVGDFGAWSVHHSLTPQTIGACQRLNYTPHADITTYEIQNSKYSQNKGQLLPTWHR